MQLVFDVPTEKITKFLNGFLRLYPNQSNGELTDEQWIREAIRAWIVNRVHRGLLLERMDQTKVDVDNGIAV
jgi:hypothetical protein